MKEWTLDLGANPLHDGSTHFKVWAPLQSSLKVNIEKQGFSAPLPMERGDKGYFHLSVSGVREGDTYSYILDDGRERADPVSRFLPLGTKGPTAIVDPLAFSWTDEGWRGIPQEEMIFYECHTGTFTPQGTFLGIIEKLPHLSKLGITCLEIMPIAEFPGKWGWGYDSVSPYAPHHAYGTPETLKQLVDACHKCGIAICLDVVYNHFGPEDCFAQDFGPYWTDRYTTPWGKAINYDDAGSDEVRYFFLKNALYWIIEYHIDALRLDALHAIYDFSSSPFIQELSRAIEKLKRTQNRNVVLIGESNLNDSRLIRSTKKGGSGLHALWNDDFHHALHVSLTHEKTGYYQDFQGLRDLKKAFFSGVTYNGKYSSYRKHSYGNSFRGITPKQLIAFAQNHDQIGNRPLGERLSTAISFEAQKMSALLLILSPYIPLLFMGQEYGEEAPFTYFVDYDDPVLMANIFESRKKEMDHCDIPFPDESSYHLSKLGWDLDHPHKTALLTLYRQLIALRRTHPIFKTLKASQVKSYCSFQQHWLAWEYPPHLGFICNFGKTFVEQELPFASKENVELLLHTEQSAFAGKENISLSSTQLSLPKESAAVFYFV